MDNSIASRLRRKKRLGDLLLGAGVITQEQLEEALKKQKEAGNGQKLGMTLVDMGIMNDEIIAEALCHQMGLERVHLAGITIEDEVLALVDEKVLRKYMLLPYEFAPEVAARTTVLCLRVETLTGKSNAPKTEQA